MTKKVKVYEGDGKTLDERETCFPMAAIEEKRRGQV